MKWANFLHFYQPADQQRDILEAVVSQCYRPMFRGLLENPRARLTINVSGGLLEALDKHGFGDVIHDLRELYKSGRIDITSTACYHAFLPLLPEDEIRRQIKLNDIVLSRYLNVDFSPLGFFPPEMAYNSRLGSILSDMGYKYVLLDEISCTPGEKGSVENDALYRLRGTSLKVFFRQRNPSNVLMSGIERDSQHLYEVLKRYSGSRYLITAMDGETFGHHRPGLEEPFLDMFNNQNIEFTTVADFLDDPDLAIKEVDLVDSTWASSREDIANGIQFISWKDPQNVLHSWQWELVNLMLSAIKSLSQEVPNYDVIRCKADRALASDQFFWASAKPWWSVEMIESGVHMALSVIESIPGLASESKASAEFLYRSVVSTAFEWQRTGKIREMSRERNSVQRIPFKARTLGVGGAEAGVYHAFVDMMTEQEKEAASRREYEKAILWRDAVHKIETGNDIYDAVNAIDLLRIELSNEKVEKVINEYKSRFNEIRGGQPEQRSN